MKKIFALFALLSVGFIAGCGSSTDQPASVSGIVADGYLQNALVFLDKNLNYQLDQGEPSTTTDQNGAYSLNVAAEDIGKYPVVAIAIAGQTIDSDNPGTPVENSYVLCTPGAAVSGTISNFISPMSTLIREKLEANPGMTLAEAVAQLRSQLNMPVGINMMGDYVAGSRTGLYQDQYQAMHQVAQQMAALMGEQAEQVINGTTGVDSIRFGVMMAQLDQYLPQLTYNVINQMGMNSEFMEALRHQMQNPFIGMVPVFGNQFQNFNNFNSFNNMTSHNYFWNYSGTTMRPATGMMGNGMR